MLSGCGHTEIDPKNAYELAAIEIAAGVDVGAGVGVGDGDPVGIGVALAVCSGEGLGVGDEVPGVDGVVGANGVDEDPPPPHALSMTTIRVLKMMPRLSHRVCNYVFLRTVSESERADKNAYPPTVGDSLPQG